jgi:hypothetical protein
MPLRTKFEINPIFHDVFIISEGMMSSSSSCIPVSLFNALLFLTSKAEFTTFFSINGILSLPHFLARYYNTSLHLLILFSIYYYYGLSGYTTINSMVSINTLMNSIKMNVHESCIYFNIKMFIIPKITSIKFIAVPTY